MKKIRFACFVSMLLLLACGCRQLEEMEQPTAVAGSHTLKAFLESEPGTRTYLSGPDAQGIYYPYWSENEEIAVYVDGIASPDKYTLVNGSGSVSGVFTGTVYGLEKVALYPYSYKAAEGCRDNVLTLDIPSVQTYKEGSFGEGVFPMVAVSSSDELGFKNLCAVLKVSMTGNVAVKSLRFVAHDSWMAVSGKATVRTDFQQEPELVMAEDGSNAVTLDCGYVPLDPSKGTDFFIVIPPGTYRGGFTVEIKTFNGTVTRSTDADIVFQRSQLRSIPVFECVADGEIDPDDIPFNQIWYTTRYGYEQTPSGSFDRNIVSNTYADGKGVIVFDGPVTAVGDYAFGGSVFTGVILPNSIETLGERAFSNSSIESFHIPDRLKSVGPYAFYSCSELTRIYGRLASQDEKALVLEDGSLVAYALGTLGADLVIPDGVKTIPASLFRYHDEIETVEFPESVESLERFVFQYCPSIREFRGNNEHVPDGHAFVNPGGAMVAWAGYGVTDYVIPSEVNFFDYSIFADNKTLHSVTVPRLSFGTYWYTDYFRGCDNLEFFYGEGATADHRGMTMWGNCLFAIAHILPADYRVPGGQGITEVFHYLLQGNATLERFSLPDDITYIGNYAFSYMKKIKSIRMPASLTQMGGDVFSNSTTLDTLYMRSFTPPSYDESDGAFIGHDGLVICVPKGFEDLYKNAPTWSKYADYIEGYVYTDLQNPDYYISTDYSRDGKVTRLQRATEGAGIDLVLMGDGFIDTQIADGTYAGYMQKMADAFFSEEPYTTLRPLFNVYAVDVVSATEGYAHPGQALGGWFGNGTLVGGNDTRCMDYARKAIGDDRMDNALIIVAMNSNKYAGTCYMYYPSTGDYGVGTSIAYFPLDADEEGLAQLVHHEAGGHGFAKLDDEYAYDGTIPQEEIDNKVRLAEYGWWKNIDFTDDPTKVKWSRFLSDDRYKFDGLGVFEGACTYSNGAWRPTENSIMRYNTGGFNAPSREAIWYRAHKLAYGESWKYDYEAFVAYDAINRKTSAGAAKSGSGRLQPMMPPTHAPVIVPRRWNDPVPGSGAEPIMSR